jgi:sulfoxide reductase heme-binding subunit YedZ
MVRRLGARRWQRLHSLVYAIALLAVVHYCMQSKLDLWEPTIIAGIYVWLMGYRLLVRLVGVRGRLPLAWVAILSLAAAGLTALGEAAYFWAALGVDPARVLSANWSLVAGWRPAAIVLGLGVAVTAIGAARSLGPLIVKRLPRFA